jgi:hypothetical protein
MLKRQKDSIRQVMNHIPWIVITCSKWVMLLTLFIFFIKVSTLSDKMQQNHIITGALFQMKWSWSINPSTQPDMESIKRPEDFWKVTVISDSYFSYLSFTVIFYAGQDYFSYISFSHEIVKIKSRSHWKFFLNVCYYTYRHF